MKKLTLFFAWFFIFSNQLSANNYKDGAIQSIASLLFHVNDLLEDQEDLDPINFEKEDVDYLFAKASVIESEEMAEVEKLYANWQEDQDLDHLKKAQSLLRKVWLEENYPSSYKHPLHQAALNIANNALLTPEILNTIQPYLLPDHLAITPIVDKIFSKRVTFNKESLLKAGFKILFEQPRSFIIVAKHPSLPKHLIKLYLDTEGRQKHGSPGWLWFSRRCYGAELIRNLISSRNIQNFSVPDKYIYILPPETAPVAKHGVDPKLAVLIVTDMRLVSKKDNLLAWKTKVSKQTLNELYTIISRANGSSYRACNIPYTKAGKFAFVDTEYPHFNPDFRSTRRYLSSEGRKYWDQLVRQGGPS